MVRSFIRISLPVMLLAAATTVPAAQLSTDARTAIPHDVQQLVVVDYRVMQNSTAAMDLKDRVMPPDLKQFDEALRKSGLNDNHDVDQLAFALFRPKDSSDQLMTVGIAQGQFSVQDILANFRKQKLKASIIRTNRTYPLAKSGHGGLLCRPVHDGLWRGRCGRQGAGCPRWSDPQPADQCDHDGRNEDRGL